ncbi:MAG TPA: ABC transporter ATP-binding protein [Gammaproteobacteria bacterium]|nr:ABC transporter ATP-binding protein [Gammaproteobacteria bacterium]
MIQIDGLRFRYPGSEREAIQDLSLRIPKGSLFGLLGPNGSGKTTLISILTGLLDGADGAIQIDGLALPDHTRDIQRFSALVPQEYAFYPRLTVIENIAFFAGAMALPRPLIRERADEAMAVAGLQSYRSARAEHLSGGLKRRLNLAIGLLNRPRLLFLDEPTVGIDPQSRHFILDAIRRINADGATVVYTSHYMEEVELLCDDIAVLDAGRLLARGTLDQLLGEGGGHRLTITLKTPPADRQREALTAVAGVEIHNRDVRIEHCDDSTLKRLMALLAEAKLETGRVRYGHGNLEDLFLHLTGRQLRD